MSEETVTFNLELNVEQTHSEMRKLQTTIYRALGLIRRLTGSEQIDAAISKIQRFIMTLRLAQSAIIAFQAASGPVGWAFAAVGIATAVVNASDFMMNVGE